MSDKSKVEPQEWAIRAAVEIEAALACGGLTTRECGEIIQKYADEMGSFTNRQSET